MIRGKHGSFTLRHWQIPTNTCLITQILSFLRNIQLIRSTLYLPIGNITPYLLMDILMKIAIIELQWLSLH